MTVSRKRLRLSKAKSMADHTETRGVLAALGWLLLAVLLCWAVIIGGVWLVINILYFMGSVLVSIPVF